VSETVAVADSERARGIFAALLAIAVLLAEFYYLRDEFNPDYSAYQIIFEEGGAWLVDQHRDFFFTGLNQAGALLFGADGFDTFFLCIAAYFVGFLYLLLTGRILPMSAGRRPALALLFGILPLTVIHFPVQIREGLALTFLLAGIGILAREAEDGGLSRRVPAFALFLLSCLTHSGTALFSLIIPGALILSKREEVGAGTYLKLALGAIACLSVVAWSSSSGDFSLTGGTLEDHYGMSEIASVDLSFGKYLYWGAFGPIIFLIHRALHRDEAPAEHSRVYLIYGRLLTGVALPALLCMAFIQLYLEAPALVVSSTGRMMFTGTEIALALTVLNGRCAWYIYPISLYLLVNQVRILLEAVLLGVFN
jgi:hypothetical protein